LVQAKEAKRLRLKGKEPVSAQHMTGHRANDGKGEQVLQQLGNPHLNDRFSVSLRYSLSPSLISKKPF